MNNLKKTLAILLMSSVAHGMQDDIKKSFEEVGAKLDELHTSSLSVNAALETRGTQLDNVVLKTDDLQEKSEIFEENSSEFVKYLKKQMKITTFFGLGFIAGVVATKIFNNK